MFEAHFMLTKELPTVKLPRWLLICLVTVIVFLPIAFAFWMLIRPSPDEARFLAVATLESGRARVATVDVITGDTSFISGDDWTARNPSWSPDGKSAVFQSDHDGISVLYMISAESGEISNVTNSGADERQPAWSPDGKKIAYTSLRNGKADIFVMNSDGSNQVNITNNPASDSDPAWSPDSKQIAFASDRTGKYRVWVMNADGTGQRDVTGLDSGGWTLPAWSPNGSQLLYSGGMPDRSGQIFMVGRDGSSLKQITTGPGWNTFAAWSSNNRYIAYVHFDNTPNMNGGTLMLFDTRNGVSRELMSERRCAFSRPSWKPFRNWWQ
jgi:Tol biopolymer transport system component